MMASTATAPITIPAIAPVEGPGLEFCVCAGVVIVVLVSAADVSKKDVVGPEIVDVFDVDPERTLEKDFRDSGDVIPEDDVLMVVGIVLPEVVPDAELEVPEVVVAVVIALDRGVVPLVATELTAESSRIQNWPV